MDAPKAHMVQMPKHFMIVRRLQLSSSAVLLGLSCWTVAVLPVYPSIITLFTAICSCIVLIWLVIANRCAPGAYNYWAELSLEIFLVVWWFISLILNALFAAYAAYYVRAVSCIRYNAFGQCTSYLESGYTKSYIAVLGATAGISALIFILFIVSIVFVSIGINRHRKAGGHSKFIGDGAAAGVNLAPMQINPNHQGMGMGMQPQPQVYPEATGYYGQPSPAAHYQPPPGAQYQPPPGAQYQPPPGANYQPPVANSQVPPGYQVTAVEHYQAPKQ